MIEAVKTKRITQHKTPDDYLNAPESNLQQLRNLLNGLTNPETRGVKRREIATSYVCQLIDTPLQSIEDEALIQALSVLTTEEWDIGFHNLNPPDNDVNDTFVEIHSTNNKDRTYLWCGTVFSCGNNTKISLTKIGSAENGQLTSLNITIDNGRENEPKVDLNAVFETPSRYASLR